METGPYSHPSEEVLEALALGKLDDTTAVAMMNHVENCPDCRRRAAAAPTDSFLDRLRDAHGATPAPDKSLTGVASDLRASTAAPGTRLPSAASRLSATAPPELAALTQYQVVRELGRGGMGVVYLTHNTLMDRPEVLKVMNRALMSRPEAADRFLREIQSAARLDHANIVRSYSAVQLGEVLVFAMEYVDGLDLGMVVQTRGPLPLTNALYYAQQTALGLQYAFEKHAMVHRDIKPHNLILAREGKKHIIKILDFGLAKAKREKGEDKDLTGSGIMLGSPQYIAPEQITDAARADVRADIYSLGCTLYYLLAGTPPFQGDSVFAILHAHQSAIAKPLDSVRPDVPAEVAAVVAKMMAKDPAQRYQTPVEVARALMPFLKAGPKELPSGKSSPPPLPGSVIVDTAVGKETQIRPVGAQTVASSGAPPARSNQLFLGVAAGAAAVLLVVAGVVLVRIATDKGDLVVETDDPNIKVVVSQGGKQVAIVDTQTKREVRLASGTYEIELARGGEGLRLSTDKFTLTRGGREIVRVRRELVAAAPTKTGLRPLSRAAHSPGGQWRTDGDALVQADAGIQYPDIWFGDFNWTDYDFSARARRVQGNEYFALMLRGFDGSLFKLQSGCGGNRLTTFLLFDHGAVTEIHKHPFRVDNERWYKAMVKVRGNHYQAFLENQLIADYQDLGTVSTQGRVGLGVCFSTYRFDQIEVRSRTGKLLWTGPPDLDDSDPAQADQPSGLGLEAPEKGSPSLAPGSVWIGSFEAENGFKGMADFRMEITEARGELFTGTATLIGGELVYAINGTVRGPEVKWEYGNRLLHKGKTSDLNGNNLGFEGKMEKGTLEGRWSRHDGTSAGTFKLKPVAVYTGRWEYDTGASGTREVRIEITQRQGKHFKGTLTSDDGPATWLIRGTLGEDELEWQWGDVIAAADSGDVILTNNGRLRGKYKDGILQGRFSSLDNKQGGVLRAAPAGPGRGPRKD
jgi:serine/threonine protein kinase